METIHSRIKEVRQTFKLSMGKFGDRIGVTASSINKIEKGENNPSEQTIKLICKEFGIDYFWLTEGTGNKYVQLPETLLDKLAERYKLSERGKIILKTYVNATEEQQNALEDFLLTLAENMKKESE